MASEDQKIKFTSFLATLVSLLGFSLGMSDFWRFPFLVYRNGGGSFLIPFAITLLLCGCPIFFLDYSIGKFSGKGPFKVWDIFPLFRGFGMCVCFMFFVYLTTGSIFRCWMMDFLLHSFSDPLPWTQCGQPWNTATCRERPFVASINDSSIIMCNSNGTDGNCTGSGISDQNATGMSAAEEFWQYKILNISTGISDLSNLQWRRIAMMAVLRIVVAAILVKSIKSLEKAMYVTTFLPIILTVAIFISSLTQPGSSIGLYYFFYPDLTALTEPRVWIEAALMVFYTLSLGWGCIILLGSHSKFAENCVRTSMIVPILDATCAVFSGMVCFSILGNMSHSFQLPITEVINAGMSSGVVGFAKALSALPFPQVWSVLFFSSVIVVSLDSQIVALEMIIQFIGELVPGLYPRYRLHVLGAVSLLLFLLSLPTCTGAGVYIFLLNDWYSGSWLSPVLVFGQLVVVGWLYGMERFSHDISMMTGSRIPAWLRIVVGFVSPAVVIVIFVTSCIKYVPPTYGSYSFSRLSEMCGWLSVVLLLTPIPGYAIYQIVRGQGHWRKRLQELVSPSDSWGPCSETGREEYIKQNRLYKGTTIANNAKFILCGRRSNHPARDNDIEEMDKLNENI